MQRDRKDDSDFWLLIKSHGSQWLHKAGEEGREERKEDEEKGGNTERWGGTAGEEEVL